MSLAQTVAILPQPRSGNYEATRFNALQRGVLATHCPAPGKDHKRNGFWLDEVGKVADVRCDKLGERVHGSVPRARQRLRRGFLPSLGSSLFPFPLIGSGRLLLSRQRRTAAERSPRPGNGCRGAFPPAARTLLRGRCRAKRQLRPLLARVRATVAQNAQGEDPRLATTLDPGMSVNGIRRFSVR